MQIAPNEFRNKDSRAFESLICADENTAWWAVLCSAFEPVQSKQSGRKVSE